VLLIYTAHSNDISKLLLSIQDILQFSQNFYWCQLNYKCLGLYGWQWMLHSYKLHSYK